MADNKTFIIIVILLIAIVYASSSNQLLSIFGDVESQLKQDYNTIWSDNTDGDINLGSCITYEDNALYQAKVNEISTKKYAVNEISCAILSGKSLYWESDKFKITGSGSQAIHSDSNIYIVPTNGNYKFELKQRFKGQEVVLYGINRGNGCVFSFDDTVDGVSFQRERDVGGSQVIVFKPHTFEPTKYDVIRAGMPIKTISDINGIKLAWSCRADSSSSERVDFHFIGYKSQFSCDITKDEVWLTERYGSRVNINDLTFIPTKLCYEEHPPTLRKLNEGEVKIYPNPYFDFNKGLTIPSRELLSDEQLTIRYATNSVSGVIDPLPPNQEYVCTSRDSSNRCSKWVIKEFVSPLEIVKQCNVDSDCPIPLKNTCPSYFTGCKSSFCTYNEDVLNSVQCKNEVVTIIKDIQKIQERQIIAVTSQNSFLFRALYPQSFFNFGKSKFEANVDYTCGIPEGETISFPNPNPDCYKAKAFFGNKAFDLKDGQNFSIRDNVGATVYLGGSVNKQDKNLQGQ